MIPFQMLLLLLSLFPPLHPRSGTADPYVLFDYCADCAAGVRESGRAHFPQLQRIGLGFGRDHIATFTLDLEGSAVNTLALAKTFAD